MVAPVFTDNQVPFAVFVRAGAYRQPANHGKGTIICEINARSRRLVRMKALVAL